MQSLEDWRLGQCRQRDLGKPSLQAQQKVVLLGPSDPSGPIAYTLTRHLISAAKMIIAATQNTPATTRPMRASFSS
jgi:hypothetical protein